MWVFHLHGKMKVLLKINFLKFEILVHEMATIVKELLS